MLRSLVGSEMCIRDRYKLSNVDPWFLNQIKDLVDEEKNIKKKGLPKTYNEFNRIKSIGFSDKKLSKLLLERGLLRTDNNL